MEAARVHRRPGALVVALGSTARVRGWRAEEGTPARQAGRSEPAQPAAQGTRKGRDHPMTTQTSPTTAASTSVLQDGRPASVRPAGQTWKLRLLGSSESSWGDLGPSSFLEQLVEQAQIDQLVQLGFLLQHANLERVLCSQEQRRGHRVDGELELLPCRLDQGRLEWLARDLGNQVRDVPLCPRWILGDVVSRVQIAGQQGLDRVRVSLQEVGAHGEQGDGELLVRPEVALVDKDLAAGLNKPGGIAVSYTHLR